MKKNIKNQMLLGLIIATIVLLGSIAFGQDTWVKNIDADGWTSIDYKSPSELFASDSIRAAKEMWTDAQKKQSILNIKNYMKGGLLTLRITRSTIGSANTEWFTIIVKDTNGIELHREKLKSDIPDYSQSSGETTWWNIQSSFINKKIKYPFHVYVVDRFADKPFKFEVLTRD